MANIYLIFNAGRLVWQRDTADDAFSTPCRLRAVWDDGGWAVMEHSSVTRHTRGDSAVGHPAVLRQWQFSVDGRTELWSVSVSSQPLYQRRDRGTRHSSSATPLTSRHCAPWNNHFML